jgi:general L-amino acid transport system substrate-binding protein
MTRLRISALSLVLLLSLLLAACGGAQPTNATPAVVDTLPVAQLPEATNTTAAMPTEAPAAEATATAPAAPTETTQPSGGQAGGAAAPVAQGQGFGETLKAVQARGNLICGVNGQLPGFSFLDPQGEYSGFDADFCRALAAAVFGDPTKVEFRPTNTQERFTVLQTGEVDVLIRNTTWSLTRDTELGLNFPAVTFYDGQGIMVPVDSGLTTLQDLDGATVCVQKGTTTELNLADVMATEGINYTPAVFDDINATYGAYAEGRCDAVTSDRSQLSSVARGVLPDPDAHTILDVTLSKEPLGPAVRHGDDQWMDIVKWTVFATFAAEEYGLTSEGLDAALAEAKNPEILRLMGKEGELGTTLGLTNDFAYNVVAAVGSYAEIYERNLGEGTPTFIPRGLNSLYTDGGLLYSPPFR